MSSTPKQVPARLGPQKEDKDILLIAGRKRCALQSGAIHLLESSRDATTMAKRSKVL